MSERPILFSAPMVRAILANRKTMTRRALKPQPKQYTPMIIDITEPIQDDGQWGQVETEWKRCGDSPYPEPYREIWRPLRGLHWQPGDRLWVREGFAYVPATAYAKSEGVAWKRSPNDPDQAVIYRGGFDRSAGGIAWKPSIHMPRWASRLTLEVEAVRVERLQDISEADAVAEGVESPKTEREDHDWSICPRCGGTGLYDAIGANLGVMPDCDCFECDTHAKRFRHLWTDINGPGSWDANPWVSVTTFRRVTQENARG